MAKHWIAGNFLGAQVDWMVYTLSSLISIVFATNDWDLAGPFSTPFNQYTTLSLHAPGRNRRNNVCRSFYVHERKKKRKRDISLSFLDRLFIILSVILSWVFFTLFRMKHLSLACTIAEFQKCFWMLVNVCYARSCYANQMCLCIHSYIITRLWLSSFSYVYNIFRVCRFLCILNVRPFIL